MPRLLNGLGKRVHLGAMSFPLLSHLRHGHTRRKLVWQTRNEGMFVDGTCRVERKEIMRTRCIGSLLAVAVLLARVGMVSAGVIRQDIEFDGRPVVLILPEHYDTGNDLLSLVIHLHGALPFANAPDLELDASGYPGLPSKYSVMVAAPRASFNPTLGLYAWNSFFSLAGCGPLNADEVGFLNSLLNELLATYPIDPQRVYIYGYSSGAAMAHRMACSNAERFAGIVAGAGFTLGDPELCAPSVPISVLQFHSKGDEVVLPAMSARH
jgi:polyhydroxybutyrate depolymerase